MAAYHVLVADDEPHIGRIVKTKLEQGPFAVTLVPDGATAIAALGAHADIAVVILDLMMPGVSGLDVLKRMQQDLRWSTIPCLVLTAAGQREQHEQAVALGAREFMTKPFSPKLLLARVTELAGIVSTESKA